MDFISYLTPSHLPKKYVPLFFSFLLQTKGETLINSKIYIFINCSKTTRPRKYSNMDGTLLKLTINALIINSSYSDKGLFFLGFLLVLQCCNVYFHYRLPYCFYCFIVFIASYSFFLERGSSFDPGYRLNGREG